MDKDQYAEKSKDIGKRIKEFRTQKQMSQKSLAELVMVSPSSITRLESGQTMVSVYTIIEIARVLDAPIADILLGGEEDPDAARDLEKLSIKLSRLSKEQRLKLIPVLEQMADAFF